MLVLLLKETSLRILIDENFKRKLIEHYKEPKLGEGTKIFVSTE